MRNLVACADAFGLRIRDAAHDADSLSYYGLKPEHCTEEVIQAARQLDAEIDERMRTRAARRKAKEELGRTPAPKPNPTPRPKPAEEAAPAAKADKPKRTMPSPNGAKDKFGTRVGTQCSLINAAITSKPKSVEQITTDSGVDKSLVKAHLRTLSGKGLVVEVAGKGWKEAGNA